MTLTFTLMRKLAFAASAVVLAAGCADPGVNSSYRGSVAIPAKLVAEMRAKGMSRSAPILVRAYKSEGEIELWKQTASGRYALLKTYPVCRWSGQLGPKTSEGDRQVPEGFYSVGSSQLNPKSRFYLSFDVGYPNAYDRQFGRSGGDIMVHGACSSRGCFAMTNEQIGEIYAVAREALGGGQTSFQVQSLPFRMTPQNLVKHRRNPNYAFWMNLKQGTDTFDVTKQPVAWNSCGGKYSFNGLGGCGAAADPAVASAVLEKGRRDESQIAALAETTQAVSVLYEDGGSHPAFAARAVDTSLKPGWERPFSKVRSPVVVALGASGAPATEADAVAARRATYAAAETLLMSEAALARRPSGPQSPKVVTVRQQKVYARLLGGKMPDPVVETPKPAAAPVMVADAAAADEPFYTRMLSFASGGPAAEPAPALPAPIAQPAKRGARNVAPAVAPQPVPAAPVVATSEGRPFYKRWLGLGKAPAPAPAQLTEEDLAAAVPMSPQGRDFKAYADVND